MFWFSPLKKENNDEIHLHYHFSKAERYTSEKFSKDVLVLSNIQSNHATAFFRGLI